MNETSIRVVDRGDRFAENKPMNDSISEINKDILPVYVAYITQNYITYLYLLLHRLVPALKLQGSTKSPASSETGKLCIESHSSVSILVTAVIAALIASQQIIDYTERLCICRMNGQGGK